MRSTLRKSSWRLALCRQDCKHLVDCEQISRIGGRVGPGASKIGIDSTPHVKIPVFSRQPKCLAAVTISIKLLNSPLKLHDPGAFHAFHGPQLISKKPPIFSSADEIVDEGISCANFNSRRGLRLVDPNFGLRNSYL